MSTAGKKPTIFVSSTCYDLGQVRADIKKFIECELGYEALLSEYNTFPTNPNLSAIDTCIRAVKERADILVLIIGNRYGSIADDGKSITNHEYISARGKGIPVYVLVSKAILAMLPIWQNNQGSDFTSVVDSPKVFEFVDKLRSSDNTWVFEFERAQDITDTLRKQFSYLFYDSLIWRSKIERHSVSDKVMKADIATLRLAVERPYAWECKFFASAVNHEFSLQKDTYRDYLLGISDARTERINETKEAVNWISSQMSTLHTLTPTLEKLIYSAYPKAIGDPGVPADLDYLLYIAERFGQVYKSILEWGIEIKACIVPDECMGLLGSLTLISDSLISDIESFNRELYDTYMGIEEGMSGTVSVKLTLSSPPIDEFTREIEALGRKYHL